MKDLIGLFHFLFLIKLAVSDNSLMSPRVLLPPVDFRTNVKTVLPTFKSFLKDFYLYRDLIMLDRKWFYHLNKCTKLAIIIYNYEFSIVIFYECM
jgi:hypothetical protein